MGSSGGSANPMFLSQGVTPMPNVPIAGQAGELKPQERGTFQEFLPEIAPAGQAGYQIMPAGQGPNPSATGLTAEMFRYRSPQGVLSTSSEVDSLRQQLAAAQAAAATPASGGGGGGGNGQFGAARGGSAFNNWGGGAYGAPNANPWSALSQMPGPGDDNRQYFASTSLGGG